MIERTLLIVKPDAYKHRTAIVYQLASETGLQVLPTQIPFNFNRDVASRFYAVHRDASFFSAHIQFMCSGPSAFYILIGPDAVATLRQAIGATDPSQAKPGTIRARFGSDLPRNAVHASDTPANAEREIAFLFAGYQLGVILD